MRGPRLSDERGIALVIAIFALVVIGALVAGTFFAGRLEQRSGLNSVYAAQAFEAAEAGNAQVLLQWDPVVRNVLVQGGHDTMPTVSLGGTLSASSIITRVSPSVFMIRTEGERLSPGGNVLARRLLSKLVRLDTPEMDIQAAVTARNRVNVGGNAEIEGHDSIPAGWGGCGALNDLAGVRTNDTVITGNSASTDGDPPTITRDSTVTDSLFSGPFEALKDEADIILPGGSYNGMAPSVVDVPPRCDYSQITNWGEPGVAGVFPVPQCQNYFPIVLKEGNLQLQDGRGQGVLLVSGDLMIRGNFEFTGLVIVLGQVETRGTGNKINGALLASNANLGDLSSFLGNPEVIYSSCAVSRALSNSATVEPLGRRSWAQLY